MGPTHTKQTSATKGYQEKSIFKLLCQQRSAFNGNKLAAFGCTAAPCKGGLNSDIHLNSSEDCSSNDDEA
eukprot:5321010-Amphidinium_carterae.1